MARKIFNLQCGLGHRFEGWFASHEALDDQSSRGLVRCPICDTDDVSRMPTAARLSLSGATQPPSEQPATQVARGSEAHEAMTAVLAAARVLAQQCEDVGDGFADEARRIHYAEVPERNIMGRTSLREARELREEGIEVFALPVPFGLLGNEH
ncbi:MAG: hypothetical protein RLZZ290_1222 [Pseudomonadota bacterium]|jgi:hypothetical protein